MDVIVMVPYLPQMDPDVQGLLVLKEELIHLIQVVPVLTIVRGEVLDPTRWVDVSSVVPTVL